MKLNGFHSGEAKNCKAGPLDDHPTRDEAILGALLFSVFKTSSLVLRLFSISIQIGPMLEGEGGGGAIANHLDSSLVFRLKFWIEEVRGVIRSYQ